MPLAPYWPSREPKRPSHPSFRGQHEADVVVIGGGLTGATAAYVLANSGLSVMLVEANRIATGATAGSLGVIVPQPDASFRAVEAAAGRRVARTAWKESGRSAREFIAVLKKLSIKCDLSPASFLINARTTDEAATLRREQSARKAAGIEAPWAPAPVAAAELGSESAGAIRLQDAATFDPVRAALGLIAAAEARGAQVFEKSAVRRTRFTRKHADVVLSTGAVRTRAVVVATGGPGALFGQLRRHVQEREGYFVATEILSAAMKRETGRRASVVTEPNDAPHWLRWLPDGRALFAGDLSKPVGARLRDKAVTSHAAELMYQLSVRHPIISGLPAKCAWSGPVVSTLDGLPWIGPHRNYPFHYFALALGWHGDGLAWFAAKAIARHLAGDARREDDAFGFVRRL